MNTASPRPVKACLFDMGNTLVIIDNARKERAVGSVLGITPDAAKALLSRDSLQDRLEGGTLSTQDFLDALRDASRRRVTDAALRAAFCDMFSELPGAATLVRELHDAGTRLVVVSNTNQIHIDFVLEHYPHLQLFDAHVYSHVIVSMKPETKFYAAADDVALAPRPQSIFIDDLAVNVDGAKAFGFAGHLMIPNASGVAALRANLRDLGALGDNL